MIDQTGHRFPSDLRLRNRREFLRVKDGGKKIHTHYFLIFVLGRPGGSTRLGITASRKVGRAVERNRIKRMVREFFRTNCYKIPENIDISVIAKRGAHLLDHRRITSELEVLFRISPPVRS